jgi:hypothetical protein
MPNGFKRVAQRPANRPNEPSAGVGSHVELEGGPQTDVAAAREAAYPTYALRLPARRAGRATGRRWRSRSYSATILMPSCASP